MYSMPSFVRKEGIYKTTYLLLFSEGNERIITREKAR